MEKIKSGRKETKSTILSRKENTSFVKANGISGALRWHSYFEQNVAGKPKFAIRDIKNEVSFSSCKYQPWYKNINNRLES